MAGTNHAYVIATFVCLPGDQVWLASVLAMFHHNSYVTIFIWNWVITQYRLPQYPHMEYSTTTRLKQADPGLRLQTLTSLFVYLAMAMTQVRLASAILHHSYVTFLIQNNFLLLLPGLAEGMDTKCSCSGNTSFESEIFKYV